MQKIKQLKLTKSPGIESISCMLELIGCLPILHTHLLEEVTWLRDLLNSTKEEVREIASVLYGTMAAHGLNDDQFQDAMKDLRNSTTNDKYPEVQHGSILAMANAVERRITIKKISFDNITTWDTYKTTVYVLSKF